MGKWIPLSDSPIILPLRKPHSCHTFISKAIACSATSVCIAWGGGGDESINANPPVPWAGVSWVFQEEGISRGWGWGILITRPREIPLCALPAVSWAGI